MLIILLVLGWLTLGAVGVSWIYYCDNNELKLLSAPFILSSCFGLITFFCAFIVIFMFNLAYYFSKISAKFPKANITIIKSRQQ